MGNILSLIYFTPFFSFPLFLCQLFNDITNYQLLFIKKLNILVKHTVVIMWILPPLLPKKGNAKECSNCHIIALISHTSKVMLKILQARLQQYMNCELPDVQAGFRKGRGTRDQIANIRWIIKKARVPEEHLFLLY